MADIYSKEGEQLKVVKEVIEIKESLYDYTFLVEQLARIQEQRQRDNDLRDAEIAEIYLLIIKAKEQGLDQAKVDESGEVSAEL